MCSRPAPNAVPYQLAEIGEKREQLRSKEEKCVPTCPNIHILPRADISIFPADYFHKVDYGAKLDARPTTLGESRQR